LLECKYNLSNLVVNPINHENIFIPIILYSLFPVLTQSRNVLNYFYGYEFWDEPEFEPMEPERANANPPKIANEKMTPLLVYPNPAQTYVIFKYDESIVEDVNLEVYDMLGRMICAKQIQQTNNLVSTEGWPPGIYVYRLSSKSTLLGTGKLIVQ
jgi:hypothetical protein